MGVAPLSNSGTKETGSEWARQRQGLRQMTEKEELMGLSPFLLAEWKEGRMAIFKTWAESRKLWA